MAFLERGNPRVGKPGTKTIGPTDFAQLVQNTARSRQLLLFIDYDGTLVPLNNNSEEAALGEMELRLLRTLSQKKNLRMVIISGRPKDFLMHHFQTLPLELAAEHGASYYLPRDKAWASLVTSDLRWYENAFSIMYDYALRVPGSFVERKQYGLCFQYRNSPLEVGQHQAIKLRIELEQAMATLPVTIIEGKKIVEVRTVEANKGRFCRWLLNHGGNNGVYLPIAVGDDRTDEDMFLFTREIGHALKIGPEETAADFRLMEQSEVLPLLEQLAERLE